jgi:NADPH2:quinone reductase
MGTIIRAARLHGHGEPLRIEEVELPEPGEDELSVDMAFGGVNPIDRYMAEGSVAPHSALPRTLGSEGSGTVNGRRVLISGGGLGAVRDGVWAQAAIVPRESVHDLPDGVSCARRRPWGSPG